GRSPTVRGHPRGHPRRRDRGRLADRGRPVNPPGTCDVVLVDDQELVRTGFRLILETESDLRVVGEAADGAAGVEVVRRLRPDVVLMDVQMPVMDGIAAARRLAELGEPARVVILTTFERDDLVVDAL